MDFKKIFEDRGLSKYSIATYISQWNVIKDLFDIHSHYSLHKFMYLEYKHSNPFSLIYKTPIYIIQCIYNIYKFNKLNKTAS